jgi:hypothetical protein
VRYKGGLLAKQFVGVCLLFCGCLPLGKAPAGQQVVHDRTLTGVFLTASEQEGLAPYLLATGSTREPLGSEQSAPFPSDMKVADVCAFRYGDGQPLVEGLAGQAPVLQDLDLPTGDPTTFAFASDSRGRLVYVKRQVDASPIYDRVERLDLVTGQVDDAGQNVWIDHSPSFLLSADRTRLFAGSTGQNVVLGDATTEDHLGWMASTNVAFIGNDLYYVSPAASATAASASQGTVIERSRPGAKPEIVASSSGELRLAPIFGDQTPQVLLSLVTDAGNAPLALLDTSTLKSVPFRPFQDQVQFMSASSNGHWLLFVTPGEGGQAATTALALSYVLYNWVSEASYRIVGSPVSASLGVEGEWRPGHDELWFALGAYPSNFGVWAAGVSPSSYRPVFDKGSLFTFPWANGRKSMFTRDGTYAVTVEHRAKENLVMPTFSIGPADDLAAPRTVLNPEGNELKSLWETMDGRILAGIGQAQSDRQDILLIDPSAPSTGASRLVGSGGHVAAVGKTRMLALLNWESSRGTGDLVLVDLATGEKSVLAESVYAVALDPGRFANASPDADRLAPGTRVAYLVRDRLESPYDGLWVAQLP